jgi:general secretion pathway protein E
MPTTRYKAQPLGEGISRDYLLWHRLCPLGRGEDGKLRVAIAPGVNRDGLTELASVYDVAIEEIKLDQHELEELIDQATLASAQSIELTSASDEDLQADARDLANQPPVIRYVNMLVRDAYEMGASDVHLEAGRTGIAARFRLDGVLTPAQEPPTALQQAIISRIKLLAELDIAERRRPQDGRIRVRLESRELDLRVSTVPTMHGESVVLRLLDRGGRPVDLDELGMGEEILRTTKAIARRPHGMLLVTGPTGSGKTTTLYAALQSRDPDTEKIITVEDPVEYQLANVTQVPVHRQAGVTFATALRAMLRQDPDVIMVGEMRDQETAEIAVQAAMTGHFVFSTLHTNDAISAVARLIDLGVPDYLVSATVEAVAAQRLVRRICDACRVSYEPPPDLVASIASRPTGRVTMQRGAGCSECRGTGYRGRAGLFELLTFTDEMREAVTARKPRSELRALALSQGMVPLRLDGLDKARRGVTTIDEVMRVTQE